jgi:hypothetical protein
LPVIIGMLVVAIFLSWDFIIKYKHTKAWLDENAKAREKT